MKLPLFPVFSVILLLNLTVCLSARAVVDRINITTIAVGGVYAIPNDGIDDTPQINAAISSVTDPSRSIYFPPGTYNYTGSMTLPANVSFRLYGDGPGVSIILFTGNPITGNTGIYAPSMGQATLNVEGLTLAASSLNCGTAIWASFGQPGSNAKLRTATIHNVQITGFPRAEVGGPYWTYGIYLIRAQNAIIDKVEITGLIKEFEPDGTQIGINWQGDDDYPTTGLQMTNLEIKFANTAVRTRGWVEGLYMTGFEIVDCGDYDMPAVDLLSTGPTNRPGFNLVNGHVESLQHGVKLTNLSAARISKVFFLHHSSDDRGRSGTILTVQNCTDAVVSQCTFIGVGANIADATGIVLDNADSVQITGNSFSHMLPANSKDVCIVIMANSNVVRIVNNLFGGLFGGVHEKYDDQNPDPNDPYLRGNYPPP
jgi:hypothetical protein